MSKGKTWIDLTDMSVWNGHLTGIQRVVYNIAKNYHNSGENVGYFIFNDKENTFHTYSFELVKERVEAAPIVAQPIAVAQGRTIDLRRLAYRVYYNSPQWVKDQLTPARKQTAKRVYHKSRQKAAAVRYRTERKKIYGEQLDFKQDDVVLIMGKPWDYPAFMNVMRQQKIEHGFKLVQVVYDLIPVFFPHLFGEALFEPYTTHMFEVAANSDALLAISQSTKRDMVRFCKDMLLPVPPIEVIRLGDDFIEAQPTQSDIPGLKPGNFILSVGTMEVRKNHQLLYSVYREAITRGIELPQLVIVGSPGWYTTDIIYEFTHDPALKDKVHIKHHTSDPELRWLYENCMFTVYPSVYEGWGLPIAESLAYGKLCLASHTSSMTEIAGDLIDYFSPYDSGECLKIITKYLDSSVLEAKESEIAKAFEPESWNSTYRQVHSCLAKLYK